MEIQITWGNPETIRKGSRPSGYAGPKWDRSADDHPGVYVFAVKHEGTTTPLYIGQSMGVWGRLEAHLKQRHGIWDRVEARWQNISGGNGNLLFIPGLIKIKRGNNYRSPDARKHREKVKEVLDMAEVAIIAHSRAKNYELVNSALMNMHRLDFEESAEFDWSPKRLDIPR